MSTTRVGRRQVIQAGAAVAAGGLALTGMAATPPAFAGDDNGLAGGWLIHRQDDGSPDHVVAVVGLAAGGVLETMDINPPSPVGIGSWAADGAGHFRATFWTVATDDNGAFVGTVKVRVRGHWDGDDIAGTYTVAVFDPAGNPLPGGTGHFSGHRIRA